MSNQLIQIKGNISSVGWIAPQGLDYDSWKQVGLAINQSNKMIGWIIGDWLNANPQPYGETYDEAMELTGLSQSRLETLKLITGSIEIHFRRQDLSLRHHEQIVKFRDNPEIQKYWLDKAEENKWSARELAEKIKQDEIKLSSNENNQENQDSKDSYDPKSNYDDEDYELPTSADEFILIETYKWTETETIRQKKVLNGETVLVNQHSDKALVQWAKENDFYIKIDRNSIWGNPFILTEDGTRQEIIEKYKWYYNLKPSLQNKIEDLRGKVLGCWCYPEDCHGNVLLNILDNIIIGK